MNTKYIDLINQTFDFPQEEFKLEDKTLQFHDIDLNGVSRRIWSAFKIYIFTTNF